MTDPPSVDDWVEVLVNSDHVELVVFPYVGLSAHEVLPHLFFGGDLTGWDRMLARPKIPGWAAAELAQLDPYPYDGWAVQRIAPPWVVLRPA